MLPLQHTFLGFLFSLILFLIFPEMGFIGFFLIFFSSILIDVDHYLFYVFKKKDLSLQKAYHWFKRKRQNFLKLSPEVRKKYKRSFLFLHGIEFLVLLILLSYFHYYFFLIFLGIVFHLLLDYAEMIYFKEPLYSKLSQIYLLKKNKNKKEFKFK